MWQWIYNPTYGVLDGLLVSVGILDGYRAWLSSPVSAMHAVILAYSWKLVPFVVIILYAALRSIPGNSTNRRRPTGQGAGPSSGTSPSPRRARRWPWQSSSAWCGRCAPSISSTS